MNEHVCPWWIGYFLASPIRKLMQDPAHILGPYVKEGMTVLEIGPGMGYFTLPIARMVGERGRVVAVDIQERMVRSLDRRARKAGLDSRIETRVCSPASLGIDDLVSSVDFALVFAVLHEMPDIPAALTSVSGALRRGGLMLIAEPAGHVTEEEFSRTAAIARGVGMAEVSTPNIRRSRSLLLVKGNGG